MEIILLGLITFHTTLGGIYYSRIFLQRYITQNMTPNAQGVCPLLSKTLDECCKKLTAQWKYLSQNLLLEL